jgi:hydrogenase maturation factor HypF (carbamoyltransferase family)
MTHADREGQLDEAIDIVNALVEARDDMRYALECAKKMDALYDMAEEALADLDMDVRLQTLIDSADELADKLMKENSCD